MNWIIFGLIIWNMLVFFLYGLDKWKSVHNRWRIKESLLLFSAFLMGGMGAFLGMVVFKHKTKHLKFKILVPLAIIVNIGIVIGYFYIMNKL